LSQGRSGPGLPTPHAWAIATIYPVTFTVTAGGGETTTQDFTLTVYQPLSFTSAPTTTFAPLVAGSFTFMASGSPPPTFSEAGALPGGVTLSPAGVLSGTPAAASEGTYPLTVSAHNGLSPTVTEAFTLSVGLLITTTSLPGGPMGPYSATLAAAGGTAPYRWGITGSLPPGLHVNARTGLISGRARDSGTFTFTVQVTDARSKTRPHSHQTQSVVLTIVIS
jgi:hypothetical protein